MASWFERRALRGRRFRYVGTSVALLCGLVLFAWVWNSSPIRLKDRLFPKHLVAVYPDWLYRSGQIDANLIDSTLEGLQIDVVVDLSRDYGSSDRDQMQEIRSLESNGIERHLFPLGGSGMGKVENYVGAVAAIARAHRAGQRVLVHCRAGDRRTGGVLATYQLLVLGESPARAREELGRYARRSTARLEAFLDTHMEQIAQGLVREGVLESMPAPVPTLAANSDPSRRPLSAGILSGAPDVGGSDALD